MRVNAAISLGFRIAAVTHREINERWIRASVRAGGALRAGSLMSSVQRCGELDMVLRAMEEEPPIPEPAQTTLNSSRSTTRRCCLTSGSGRFMRLRGFRLS